MLTEQQKQVIEEQGRQSVRTAWSELSESFGAGLESIRLKVVDEAWFSKNVNERIADIKAISEQQSGEIEANSQQLSHNSALEAVYGTDATAISEPEAELDYGLELER